MFTIVCLTCVYALAVPGGSRGLGPLPPTCGNFVKKNKDNQMNFKGENSKLYPNCK